MKVPDRMKVFTLDILEGFICYVFREICLSDILSIAVNDPAYNIYDVGSFSMILQYKDMMDQEVGLLQPWKQFNETQEKAFHRL